MRSADEVNRRYFREAYRAGTHGWAVVKPSPYAVRFLRAVARRVSGGRLLDLGCGEGRHALAAARLGFRVTAVDREPLALRRARSAARSAGVTGITFLEADVFRLPFPEAFFDAVLDYGFLHHQRKSDWPAYRRSVRRVLRPGGYYLLSVFSPRFRLFRGARRPWHIAYGAYRRCFTAKEILALFSRDFEIVRMTEERGKGGGFWHTLMKGRAEAG